MTHSIRTIPAGKFKAECLQLMDYVKEKHISLVITKHGVPVAKIVPIEEEPINLFGILRGNLKIKGNIISTNEEWNAER
jgi:prevent-host-death family protein